MLTINAIRQTARGTPIWQPGAINLHVSVPCPLKVRLKEALGARGVDAACYGLHEALRHGQAGGAA